MVLGWVRLDLVFENKIYTILENYTNRMEFEYSKSIYDLENKMNLILEFDMASHSYAGLFKQSESSLHG